MAVAIIYPSGGVGWHLGASCFGNIGGVTGSTSPGRRDRVPGEELPEP